MHAMKGKVLRAERVSALFERGEPTRFPGMAEARVAARGSG